MDTEYDKNHSDDLMDGTWHTATAETDAAGIRVDKWLAGWTELSRARIGALIDARQVRADGDIITKPTNKVREGVEYAVFVPPPVDDTPKPENIPLDILYEDDQLIVVNKPAGMTVHPAPGSRSATLVNALLYHCADSLSGIGGICQSNLRNIRSSAFMSASPVLCPNHAKAKLLAALPAAYMTAKNKLWCAGR